MAGRLNAEAQVAALQAQVTLQAQQFAAMTLHAQTLVGEQQYLRVQNCRIVQCVSTAHALLSRFNMHPTQAARWCSEALQVLEPELADHPLRDRVGKTSVVPAPILHP